MVTISIQGICAAQRWTVCIDNSHHLMSVNQKTEEKLITSEDPGQSARICHWIGDENICLRPQDHLPTRRLPIKRVANLTGSEAKLVRSEVSFLIFRMLCPVSQCTTWTFETCQVSARANRSYKIVAAVIEQRNIYQRAVDLLTFRWWTWTKSTSILE